MGKIVERTDVEKNLSETNGDNLKSVDKLKSTLGNIDSNVENQTPNSTDEEIVNSNYLEHEDDQAMTTQQNGEKSTNANNNVDNEAVAKTSNENTTINEKKREFKLRIVPLEKLLAKPEKAKDQLKEIRGKSSPPPLTTINIDDSDDSIDNIPIIKINVAKKPEKIQINLKDSQIKIAVQNNNNNKNQFSKNSSSCNNWKNLFINSNEKKQNNCRKLKIKIKRLTVHEIKAATKSISTAYNKLKKVEKEKITNRNTKRITRRNHNNKMMSQNDDKPTTSARALSNRKLVSSDEDESDTDIDTSHNEHSDKDNNNDNDDYDNDNNNDDDENYDGKSSDSEIMPVRKKRVFNKRKKSSTDDSDFEPKSKKKDRNKQEKKRRRIKNEKSSDENASGSDSGSGSDEDGDGKNKHKRKHIRKIIKTSQLDISTKNAAKEEEDRRKRIEERQKLYNQIYEKAESTEVKELILDFEENTQKTLLEVDKGLLKKLKPHQVTGVKFMWDACFETVHDINEKPGSGCILAHCMGLGKTLQIVTLAHTLLSNSSKTGVERVLVISPLSTLNNWAREFIMWMSYARKRNIEIYDMSKYRDKNTRIYKLNEWFTEGGVCILGYDMYRILANEKAKGLRKKQRETLQQSLVDPGPDLVVCDEGHLLKNEKTSISKAVTKMRTKRRIVLTGTPLQNNLKEYYCMIQFIKPNLLGTYKEYMNRFVNPITNGQYTDSTERDIRLMKHRSHILHKMLEGCIQRRDYSVLAPYLPPKHEYVVYTTLSPLQQKLYEFYMTKQRDLISSDLSGKGARLFQDFQDLRRIWTHPMCLRVNSDSVMRKRLLANEDDSMDDFICDDEDDAASTPSSSDAESNDSGSGEAIKAPVKKRKTRNTKTVDDSDLEFLPDQSTLQEKDDPSEWWKKFVEEKDLNDIHHSPKMMMLMKLLQESEAIGDKLLVFSQSLQSLDVIEHFLSLIDSQTKSYEIEDANVGDFKGIWTPGVDYFRLDGTSSVEQREVMCKKFNDQSNIRARLFLISTRAGGLGINLVAANRVVIFDVSWNPSHDTQSIFRVYRFGQDKPCYIYRLIAMGTMEQKVYERQVAKQATAKRVIDEQQISRHYNQSDLLELYTYELNVDFINREIPILPKDRLFAELLSEHDKLIYKYHEHDSLLENEESENLSEAERKAAWSEYEAEKTRTVQTAQYISYDRGAFGGNFGNASGSVTSNKIFGFRSDVLLELLSLKIAKDHPELTPPQVTQIVPSYLSTLYNEMNTGDPTMYKELLLLHQTLERPGGMYMNPLLFANQHSNAAGYYQAANAGLQPQMQPPPTPMFDPNQVIELE